MKPAPLLSRSPRIVPFFRVVANLEAVSWAGLLIGMLFKYVPSGQVALGHDLVTLFGRLHGALVIVYAAAAVATALRLRWKPVTAALALAATVPPFATVAFDLWAHRAGRYRNRVDDGGRA